VAVNTEGRREVLGLATGPSEAEPFWTEFLRSLMRRGLRGVKLVVSDAHEGLKAAVAKVLNATWQRCRVHFLRNALAYANKGQRQMVFALINTIFAQESAEAAHQQWRVVTDQLREKFPRLAAMMDAAEHEVLAFMDFPKEHRVKIHSTNVLERLKGEIKRRADVVGIFPNDRAIPREPDCATGAQPMPAGIGERLSDVAARAPRKPAVPRPSKAARAKGRLPPQLPEADRGCSGATW
jgi:putative transposase